MTNSKYMLLVAVLFLVGNVISSNGFAGPTARGPVVGGVDEDAAEKPFVPMEGVTYTCSLACGNQTISCTTGKGGITSYSTSGTDIIVCTSGTMTQRCVCNDYGAWSCETF